MKTVLKNLAVIAACTTLVVSAGCAGGNAGETISSQPTTTQYTCSGMICESTVEGSTEAPTETVTEESTINDSTTVNGSEIIKERLIAKKWTLKKCIVDGKEENPAVWYGHFIAQTGAYLEFHADDTFKCIMGFISCEGTYTVENETVSMHITGEMNGSSREPEPVDKYRTPDCDFDSGVIRLDYCYGDRNQVTNIFEDH